MEFKPIIPKAAYPFLRAQRGAVAHVQAKDTWKVAYAKTITDIYAMIEPHFPRHCRNLLDVGSGLGAIDVLIHRKTSANVYLLDGTAAAHTTKLYRKPINDMMVAREFLHANGVRLEGYYSPGLQLTSFGAEPYAFDLVVSFASWCFHYPPRDYIEFIAKRLRRGGRLIVEVRRGRPDYVAELLAQPIRLVALAGVGEKFERHVYERQ
jgi:SAM-dependent methyltransferase